MIQFPIKTELNLIIPKNKFYKNKNSYELEMMFKDEINEIYWKYKLSSETLNISNGKLINEIEVIEILLKEQKFSSKIIEIIDNEIPYHIIYVLKYRDLGQICITNKVNCKAHKEKARINYIFKSDWFEYNNLSLKIEGLNMDQIYEGFLKQIAKNKLSLSCDNNGTEYLIEKLVVINKLEKNISKLQKLVNSEKQPNKRFRLNDQLKKLITELEQITH